MNFGVNAWDDMPLQPEDQTNDARFYITRSVRISDVCISVHLHADAQA